MKPLYSDEILPICVADDFISHEIRVPITQPIITKHYGGILSYASCVDTAYVREILEIVVEIRILEPETIRMTHGMSGKGLLHVVQMVVWCRGISHQKCLSNSVLGFFLTTGQKMLQNMDI